MLAARHNGTLTNTSLDIVAATATIALPSNFAFARLVERVITSGTVPLWWNERFDSPNYTAGVTSSSDYYLPHIRFEGVNLVLEPTPLESVTGGIKLTYYFLPTRLSNNTDTPSAAFHEFYHDLLVGYCVIQAKSKEEAIGQGGADLGAFGAMQAQKEQMFKSTIEVPTVQRSAVQPFGHLGAW